MRVKLPRWSTSAAVAVFIGVAASLAVPGTAHALATWTASQRINNPPGCGYVSQSLVGSRLGSDFPGAKIEMFHSYLLTTPDGNGVPGNCQDGATISHRIYVTDLATGQAVAATNWETRTVANGQGNNVYESQTMGFPSGEMPDNHVAVLETYVCFQGACSPTYWAQVFSNKTTATGVV